MDMINSKSLNSEKEMTTADVMKYVYVEYSHFMCGDNDIQDFSELSTDEKNLNFVQVLNSNIPDKRYQLKRVVDGGGGMIGFDMSDPSDGVSIPITGHVTSQKVMTPSSQKLLTPASVNNAAGGSGSYCTGCNTYNAFMELPAGESYTCYACRN